MIAHAGDVANPSLREVVSNIRQGLLFINSAQAAQRASRDDRFANKGLRDLTATKTDKDVDDGWLSDDDDVACVWEVSDGEGGRRQDIFFGNVAKIYKSVTGEHGSKRCDEVALKPWRYLCLLAATW